MHYGVLLAGVAAVSACGQKAFSTPVSARTSAAPDETFGCMRKQLGELGYKQTSLNTSEYRVTASKVDDKTRRSDTQFRRMLNKLDVEVAAEADGQTGIKAIGSTFAEYTTQRGPTEEQEKPSKQVTSDVQTLLERCRS